MNSQVWLDRFGWMDPVGDPLVAGAGRRCTSSSPSSDVVGMRLIGLARKDVRKAKSAAAVVANREPAEAEI